MHVLPQSVTLHTRLPYTSVFVSCWLAPCFVNMGGNFLRFHCICQEAKKSSEGASIFSPRNVQYFEATNTNHWHQRHQLESPQPCVNFISIATPTERITHFLKHGATRNTVSTPPWCYPVTQRLFLYGIYIRLSGRWRETPSRGGTDMLETTGRRPSPSTLTVYSVPKRM